MQFHSKLYSNELVQIRTIMNKQSHANKKLLPEFRLSLATLQSGLTLHE